MIIRNFVVVVLLLFPSLTLANTLFPRLKMMPQNALTILHQQMAQYEVKPFYEKKLKYQYLKHYFQPWQHPFSYRTRDDLKKYEYAIINAFSNDPGWNENKKRHLTQWIKGIIHNAHWRDYPNHLSKAIVTKMTDLRELPSDVPSYGNPKVAGQGAPFDNLQASVLHPNLPVYVLHTTQDGAWSFVISPGRSAGWVKTVDIAHVNKKLIQRWIKNHLQYVTSIRDNVPVKSQQHQFYFHSRIGQIYPLIQHHVHDDEILVAVRDMNGNAHIRSARVSNKVMRPWPLKATSQHIAAMANRFMGEPYGWGNAYNYRDCSSTTQDLLSLFAIWLPRHSTEQALMGVQYSIDGLKDIKKQQWLLKKAIPYFTLLWMHGHVMLYIGQWKSTLVIFHTPWGVHSKNLLTHNDGRIIIGKTSITPIDLGKGYQNVPKTWLNKLKVFTVLVPRPALIRHH